MPSLVEQFKQALVSKKALEAFSSAFKEGYINPLDWAIDEITQLNREYSQLFALDDYHFIEERILFNQNFAQLLERVCLDCKDPIKKDLFAQTNFLCANYIQSIQKSQKSKKRPLEKPTLPKPKKRRLSSTFEQIDASKLQHLTELGYAPTHARAILSSKRARPNYCSLTRWHELFINLFSHEQLVQITLEGGESSFIALSEYLLPLVNYRFSSQDIFRLIKKPKAFARIACIFNHMDDLVMRGFNYQQLVIMGESEYAIHNLPQINEKIYAFHGDEVTEFVSKSPPEFFLLIYQNLDFFISLSLSFNHLMALIHEGDLNKLQWLINHYAILNVLTPDILCSSDIRQLELNLEKINQLIVIGYSKELLYGQTLKKLEFLIECTPRLINLGYGLEEIMKLIGDKVYPFSISEFITYFQYLSDLGYPQDQIKQMSLSCGGLPLLTALVKSAPALLTRGYSSLETGPLLINILTSVSEHEASSLKDAVKFTPLMLAQGIQPPDLIQFFCQSLNHNTIITLLLPYLPQLFEHGLSSERIMKLAANFNLNTYLPYFIRLKELNYSCDQILQMENNPKYKKLMGTLIETTPELTSQGYSTENILTIATKCYPSALIPAKKFTPPLITQGYSLSELIHFFSRQIKHSDVIQTLLEVTPTLIAQGLTTTQIIKMAPFCKREGLLLLANHFQQIYDAFKVREANLSKEKLLSALLRHLSGLNALNFIKNFLSTINVSSEKTNHLLPHLLKKTHYYCPQKKSYLFIYPTAVRDMYHVATDINATLRVFNYSGKVKALKEHFILVMPEQLWSHLWPNLTSPREIVTPQDLQDKSLHPQNYYRAESQDTAIYINCNTRASAVVCANHLKYLNQQVQKANEGIEEAIPQFQAIAMDKYVLIDNYGAYFDSLTFKYAERYDNLPNNVDDFRVLTMDEAQRLGLITQGFDAEYNSIDALSSEIEEFFAEGKPQEGRPSSSGSLNAFGFFSATPKDAEQIDIDASAQELDPNPFK